ncbi:MAG: AAA family ATPase, partial [Phycisphaerae bacterium]
MYSNHFGLRCRPFEDWVDTQFFYATADCEETLAAMEYESQHGRGISLLLGEAGTGKTLLIRTLLHRLDTSDHVAVLAWLPGEQVDLVRETAKGFGVSLPPSHHNARCVARLRRHLTYTRKANHRSVLIIDQAENLTPEAMTQLAALTDLQHDGERLLNIALVGQPHVRSVLDDPQFAQISQQLYGEHILRPLTLPEAERYVQHRLRIAGAGDVSLFDQEAVALIHEASNGIPRLINHMCDAAMLAACSAGESRINSDIAAEVARKGGSEERCANASELGVTTAEQVAIGLPYEASSHVPADHAVTGSTRANQPSTAVVEERVDDWYRSDGRKQDAVVALPEPTLARGEMLLERLERVLARADRMNATSEASLAQFTAVEKHLTALTDGAERLIGSLAETVEKTNESVDGLQRRLDDALGQAETRTQTIEAQLSLASDLSTDAEDQARCIEVACGHADQVESGLTSFAEQLADRADEVQKRMTLLLTGLQTSEEVQSKLDGTLQQASSTTATVEEKVNALRTALDETKTEAERFQKKFTDVTLVDCQQKLQEQLEAHLRTQQETMDATVTAHRARLQELIDESASQMRAFDHAIAAGRQKIDETLADAECSRTELCDAIRHESDQLTQQVEILERRQGSMASPVSAISDELEAAGTKVRDLTGTVRNVESSVEQLTQRASAAEMSLSPVVQQAEKLLPDMSGVCGQVEALQRSVSTTLLDIGGACERAGAVRDQAVQCEQIVVRLASGRAEGEKTAKQLEEVVASARQPLQDMQRTVVDATEKSGRLGSQNASAAKVLERLSEANVTGQTLIEQAGESTRAAEEMAETVKEQITQLTSLRSACENGTEELGELVTSANQLHEAMQGTVAHADEKSGQLDSRNASAAKVLEQLSETNVAGQTLIEQAGESTRAAEEAAETVKEQLTQLTSLRSACEDDTEELRELVTSANQLHEAMQGAVAHTDEKIGQLDSHNAAAINVLRNLAEANAEGHTIIERVNESTQSVEQAADNASERVDRLVQ